jgi:hypothetical protein
MTTRGHLNGALLRIALLLTCALTLSLIVVRPSLRANDHRRSGPTVLVNVVASDSSGRPLSYSWRSTDGFIKNVNAASTLWTLPTGPGLHFAYVLVSNGVGGYTERRIAVNTDNIEGEEGGEGGRREGEGESGDGRKLVAPPAPAQQGDYFRSFVVLGTSAGLDGGFNYNANVYMPDATVSLQDTTNPSVPPYPLSGPASTDAEGQFIIPGFPSGTDSFNVNCGLPFGSNFSNMSCGSDSFQYYITPPPSLLATTDYFDEFANSVSINGSLTLQDGTPCGTQNEFFGVHVSATATLLDANGNNLAGPVRANSFGYYALPIIAGAASVLLQCEQAQPIVAPIVSGNDLGQYYLANATQPSVSSMSATLQGNPVGTFLPPPSGFPSDLFPSSEAYLAFKGLDSRLGACQYYKAVGAVLGCDSEGNFFGPVKFEDWKRTVKIGKYATGEAPEYVATYVNKVDLNLTRNHHSISYGPNQTAAVVCNHLGPPGATPAQLMNPTQDDIETAIKNTLNNKNLVACVAMDFTISPGVNNDQPFVRFLIFGPDGSLLPSINLDGRREKFVPGTCVVCHGGDHYAGKFPEDGSGFANVGGHFLPYDVGNFEFSSKPGLTKEDQQQVIYLLNQNILNAGPTQAERNLLGGWYANGPVLNESYLPSSWVYDPTNPGSNPNGDTFYQNVVARSCRTCHTALSEEYNFDDNLTSVDNQQELCGVIPNSFDGFVDLVRYHSMPNSLVTFNRFWLSGTSVDQTGEPNQVSIYNLYNAFSEPDIPQRCVPGTTP